MGPDARREGVTPETPVLFHGRQEPVSGRNDAANLLERFR
jgi:hypothetical protein